MPLGRAGAFFFLHGLTIQADRNVLRVKAVLDLYERLKDDMLERNGSRFTIPLLDAMFAQPIFQAGSLLERKGMAQRANLMRQLGALVDAKVLKVLTVGSGRRATVYIAA